MNEFEDAEYTDGYLEAQAMVAVKGLQAALDFAANFLEFARTSWYGIGFRTAVKVAQGA